MGRLNKAKQIDKMKYLVSFLLTIIIFSGGLLLGSHITSKKIDALNNIEENIRLETLGAEVQYQILIGNPCQFVNSTPLSEELYELAEKLGHLENIYGEDDKNVLRLKEQYSLLEVRHWLYTTKIRKECGTDDVSLLYFYSNEGDCSECEEQGYVLTYIRKKYPNINVYSFDVNIENNAVDTIKNIYDVETTPTIVIDSIVYPNSMSKVELERALLLEK